MKKIKYKYIEVRACMMMTEYLFGSVRFISICLWLCISVCVYWINIAFPE